MLREYETLLVLDPDVVDQKVDEWVNRAREIIEKDGGSLLEATKWGKRTFAYEVKHKNEGFYVVLRMAAEPSAVEELSRVLKLADEVIRHKTIRLPKEALVEGAKKAKGGAGDGQR